jgi:hypothetical protein
MALVLGFVLSSLHVSYKRSVSSPLQKPIKRKKKERQKKISRDIFVEWKENAKMMTVNTLFLAGVGVPGRGDTQTNDKDEPGKGVNNVGDTPQRFDSSRARNQESSFDQGLSF